MPIVGQAQTDPVTGVAGDIYNQLVTTRSAYNGLSSPLATGGRNSLAALVESVAWAVVNDVSGGPAIPALPTTGLLVNLRADLGVTLDGSGNVSAWADQSTGGNNATQPTAGNRPNLVLGACNGLPAVRFDGATSWMSIADNAAYKLTSIVVCIVCRSAAVGTVVIGYPYASTQISPYFDWVLYTGNIVVDMRVATVDNSVSNAAPNGLNRWWKHSLYVLANEDPLASNNQTLWANGGDGAVFSGAGTAITYPNATGIFLGAHASGSGEYLKGDICEVAIYDATYWTATTRATVQQVLATRWGLALDGQ